MDTARWLEAGEPLSSFYFGGRRGLLVIVAVALLAAWSNHPAAVFLLLGLLGLIALARLWSELALRAVAGRHELLEDRAFPGDSLQVRLAAHNHKLLPLSWLRVRSAIPPALTPSNEPRRWPGADRGGYLQGLAALAWHSGAVWEFEVPCRARGVHQVGPLELTSGDPFGFFTRRVVLPERSTVVVYPRIVPLRRLGFPLSAELGMTQRRKALHEDPSRIAGVREYRPGDPLRRIHWRATARQGELQVRLLEPAAAPLLMLVMAVDTYDFPWPRYREDLFELAASALASIAWRAIEDGWQVGLVANGRQPVTVPPACNPHQLAQILEELARLEPSASTPLDHLLADREAGSRPATYAIALGRSTPALDRALERLVVAHRPTVILYGDEPPDPPRRMPAYHLRHWDDLAACLEGHGASIGGS